MNILINPKVIEILGVLKQGALSVWSQGKTGISAQTIHENSFQSLKAKKAQPEPLVNPQSVSSCPRAPKVKAAQSAFVEKYEMGSGKNRLNVRIFKEPIVESTNIKP